MKRIFCALVLAVLLLALGQSALALSPVGETGALKEYGFTVAGAELGAPDPSGRASLTLRFTFENRSQSVLSCIPLQVTAYQNSEELYCTKLTLKPETGDIAPGDSAPFEATFLLESETDDVTFTVRIFFSEEEDTFDCTFNPSELRAGSVQAQATQTPAKGSLLDGLSWLFEGRETPEPMDLQTYELGADVLASIPAIVGHRECVESGAGSNGMREYTYRSETVRDDLLTYINYLGEQGFEVVRGASLAEPGEGELAGPSNEPGQQLHIALDWTLDRYHIRITRAVGTGQGGQSGGAEADQAVVDQGRALLEANSFQEALALYDDALVKAPDAAVYHGGRGEALMGLGRHQEALVALNAAIELDPSNWTYFNRRGVAFYALGSTDEAVADFEEAIALQPTMDDAYYNLAYVQLELGKAYEASNTTMLGLNAFGGSTDLWLLLGDAKYALGQYNEAVVAYDEAILCGGVIAGDIGNYAKAKDKFTGAGSTDAPAIQPSPLPDSENSLLRNYEDWIRPYVEVMPFQSSILDGFLESTDMGNGWVQEAVAYPQAWPSRWLDGAIPPYTGTGWMFDLYVMHPSMSYAAERLRHVAVTVYNYDPAEVDAYITGLAAYGLQEMESSPYNADWVHEARSFRSKDCMLSIVLAEGEGGPMRISQSPDEDGPYPCVQFYVDFFRDVYAPDPSPTADTELMNYEQWCNYADTPVDQRQAMDQVTASGTDEAGRYNERILYPSQWPKDVFGECIPEYTMPGAMFYMEVTTPSQTPARDQTLIASLYIVGHYPQYIEEYARQLVAFGYREVPQEEFSPQEAANVSGRNVYRVFTMPNMHCQLSEYVENGNTLLQITLTFEGRYENFFAR